MMGCSEFEGEPQDRDDQPLSRGAQDEALGPFQQLLEQGLISDLDFHFARFAYRLADRDQDELALAALLARRETSAGHVCADLPALAGKAIAGTEHWPRPLAAPEWPHWSRALKASGVVGAPGDRQPLVLDPAGRLYVYRYWDYEQRLAASLHERAGGTCECDLVLLRRDLDRLFPATGAIDWQRIAATVAMLKPLCVIAGGPGTGKTTTVVKLLALLLSQQPRLRIGLAAPTGKAAARLQQSIRDAKQNLTIDATVATALPDQAVTLHRLLGPRRYSTQFRFNSGQPLPLDVVVLDEASMADLALMTKLVEALLPTARLILLGDKDQLASVEAGAVLADICGPLAGFSPEFARRLDALTAVDSAHSGPNLPTEPASPLRDCVVLLRESHRFAATSGIGALARSVNEGRDQAATELLAGTPPPADLGWRPLGNRAELAEALDGIVADALSRSLETLMIDDAAAVLAAFNRFRVLCAIRAGPFGTDEINRSIERILHRLGLIDRRQTFYAGRPVMINRNDYGLQLFNGDVGVTLPDSSDGGRLKVCFEGANGAIRRLHPSRLPAHETVYAMTVHKSQGSEFDRVLLILPVETSPVLSRELLYTGITRARRRIDLWARKEVVAATVRRPLQRISGLREALWSGD